MRRALKLLGIIVALVLAVIFWGYWNARADPILRRASIGMVGWPAGARPIRVVLLSDIHIESPAMDASRLRRIVDQVNALRPDLVLLAGDFVEGHDAALGLRYAPLLTVPLSALRAPLGVVAILGNHDHSTNVAAVRGALERAHIQMVVNGAVARGPLAIAGLDDQTTGHARIGPTLAALRTVAGARLMVAHSPDIAADLPADIGLVLAGHTHCGQIVLPLIGPLVEASHFGPRYRCGRIDEGSRTTIVTAGVGTSIAPLRFGAPPDLWLLELGPSRPRS